MSIKPVSSEADTAIDLFRLQFSKFLNVGAFAAIVFDYCLTFPREVEHVWGTKWEITRIVFTLSRYLGLISSLLTCYDALVNERCGAFVLALDAMYTASIILSEGILILRTYALWARSKRVLILLVFLAAIFIAGAEVTTRQVKIVLPGDSTSSYQFYSYLCTYQTSRNAAILFGFLVAYEIILQSMCSWRKFRTYRNVQSRTLNTLYWDGILYMSCVVLVSGANMSVIAAAPITCVTALDTAQVALHSILASRIFFNLRECDKQMRFNSTSTGEMSLETLRCHTRSSVDAATRGEVSRIT